MPLLIYHKDAADRLRLAVWRISESTSELLGMTALTEVEKTKLQSIKLEKRKREWLSVKILLNLFAGGKSISFLPNGKPVLSHGQCISISHSGDLGGVILSEEETGLDIQGVDERILRIEHKFVNDDERNYLPSDSFRVEYLTVIWSVKEAVFKYFGEHVEFSKDITVNPFSPKQAHLVAHYDGIHGKCIFQLTNLITDGYNIVYITNTDKFS